MQPKSIYYAGIVLGSERSFQPRSYIAGEGYSQFPNHITDGVPHIRIGLGLFLPKALCHKIRI